MPQKLQRLKVGTASAIALSCLLSVTVCGCSHHLTRPGQFKATPRPSASGTVSAEAEYSKIPWSNEIPGSASGGDLPPPPVPGSRLLASRSTSRAEPGGAQATSPATSPRMMVYTSWLTMVVHEPQAAVAQAEQIAQELGGYVQRVQGLVVTLRIPADRYQEAIKRIETLGQVADRRLQAEDKTDEFVDLEARLKNAIAVRGRLAELLARAENVEAALKVELELKRVGEEIERLTAQLENLRNQIALGTITLTFQSVARQDPSAAPLGRLPFEWLRELSPTNLLRN